MKILVCTDGSEKSKKAIQEASVIAEGCKVDEVAVIHVYDYNMFPYATGPIAPEHVEQYQKIIDEQKAIKEKMLSEDEKIFKEKKINTHTILKEGNPSDVIIKIAQEEGFDMIVVGSRGLGGLKKILLGSVSNAIMQEAENCSVLVVK